LPWASAWQAPYSLSSTYSVRSIIWSRLKPPLLWLVQRIAYRLPAFLYEALPMIVLVSTVCLFVSLVRRHELDALKAAGVSLYRLCLPILVVAGLVSLGALLFAETLLPKLNARAQHAEWLLTKEPPADTADSGPGEWYRVSEERFLRARIRDRQERALDHAVLLEVNERFQLETRWDAEAARWISDGWEFSNGLRWDSQGATSVPFASTMLRTSEPFEEFTHWENRAPATMSFREMREYVASRYRRGYDADEYAVDLYSKVSFLVVHLVMALFAIPCALAWGPRSAPALGIGIAIGVSLSYWVIHALALSLGKAGLLPPMLAAWTANIIFTGLGIAGFLNVRT
jgi:lipopolysaccharide export system permease protein